jgi:hypothetical protein
VSTLAIDIKKYLKKAKEEEELGKLKYFTMQKYRLQKKKKKKISLKETKTLQDIITLL